jgi:hypothetical protein
MGEHSPNKVARLPGLRLHPLAGLGLGLVAALVIWGLIQTVHPVFKMPRELHIGMGSPWDLIERHRAEQRYIDRRHGMLYLGSLGAVLGLALGIGESVSRRSMLPVLLATLLGVGGGVLGGLLGCLVQEHVRANVGLAELQHTVEVQLGLAIPLAAALGLGLGLSTRSFGGFWKTLLAGLAVGILGGVIYPIVASILSPNVSTDSFLPDDASSRLVGLGLLAGLIGVAIPIAGRQRGTPPPSEKS